MLFRANSVRGRRAAATAAAAAAGGGGGGRVTLHAASCPVSAVAPAGIDLGEKPGDEKWSYKDLSPRVFFFLLFFGEGTQWMSGATLNCTQGLVK